MTSAACAGIVMSARVCRRIMRMVRWLRYSDFAGTVAVAAGGRGAVGGWRAVDASGGRSSNFFDVDFLEIKQQRVTDPATSKTTTPATAPTMTPTFELELLLGVGAGEPEGGEPEGGEPEGGELDTGTATVAGCVLIEETTGILLMFNCWSIKTDELSC